MQDRIKPIVYVIIPNKNGLNHLVYSLLSLKSTSYTNYHCVGVDNSSTDDSIAFVKESYKTFQILENKKGKGFASTINVRIKYTLGQEVDNIAIDNSDIKLWPEWIDLVIKGC